MTGRGVTVVVPAWNAEPFLGEALTSVLRQTRPVLEVLVVDDGSTDGTGAVAGAFGPPVRVLRQENRGVAAARNRGLSEARGGWTAFLDADDAWLPDKVAAQLAAVTSDPAAVACHCAAELIDAEGRRLGLREDGRGGEVLEELVTFRRPVVVSGGSGLMALTALLREMGGFRETLSTSADWDLYRRLAARGSLAYVETPLVRYRMHSGNMHRNLDRFEADMTEAMRRAFEEPPLDAASPALRREAWGTLYRIFAGARYRAGETGSFLRWAGRSLLTRPAGIGYFAGLPLRRLRGRRDHP